jgi:hypothetical protein
LTFYRLQALKFSRNSSNLFFRIRLIIVFNITDPFKDLFHVYQAWIAFCIIDSLVVNDESLVFGMWERTKVADVSSQRGRCFLLAIIIPYLSFILINSHASRWEKCVEIIKTLHGNFFPSGSFLPS